MSQNLLEVMGASFSYDGKRDIFSNLDFSTMAGEVFCIVGPNGCGKTSLIDCLLDLRPLKTGSIYYSGYSIAQLKAHELAREVAYVPQGHRGTFAYSVLDIVMMARTHSTKLFSSPNHNQRDIARQAIAMVGLQGFEDRSYLELSGGELQLVLIARAVAQQAKILVMDEPTAHLDFSHEMDVIEVIAQLVREQGIGVVMATHFLNQPYYLDNAGISTRVALMNRGRFLAVGRPDEVLSEENLKSEFQIVSEIITTNEGRQFILPLRKERR